MVGLVMGTWNRLARSQRALRAASWSPIPGRRRLANKGIDALTFSGGVAEYLYKREETAAFRATWGEESWRAAAGWRMRSPTGATLPTGLGPGPGQSAPP